jgi:hypothetical protein
MLAAIADDERKTLFHISKDQKWVATEFVAFKQANPTRYRAVRINKTVAEIIRAADHGKLIVLKKDKNPHVHPLLHLHPRQIKQLLTDYLIVEDLSYGWRLSRYGQTMADHLWGRIEEE